jgi:hypothetical protein
MFDEAVALAREAVVWAKRGQAPDVTAQALADLAEVFHLAGGGGAAIQAAKEALVLYKRRGDLVHQRQLTDFLGEFDTDN